MTINYDLPAGIQKRIQAETTISGFHAGYVFEGTLVECLHEVMAKTPGEQHLYEIHTEQQPGLTTTILQLADVADIAACPDFPER
jgi:hypothetical protein